MQTRPPEPPAPRPALPGDGPVTLWWQENASFQTSHKHICLTQGCSCEGGGQCWVLASQPLQGEREGRRAPASTPNTHGRPGQRGDASDPRVRPPGPHFREHPCPAPSATLISPCVTPDRSVCLSEHHSGLQPSLPL